MNAPSISMMSGACIACTILASFAGAGPPPACPGDLDGDGATTFEDLATLLDDWGCRLEMFAWEGSQPQEVLRRIDLAGLTSTVPATPAGFPTLPIIAEIEYLDGVIYAADTDVNSRLHRMDAATGAWLGTLTLVLADPGRDVITSLEFIDGVLHAGLTREGGGGGETRLVTINLTTGVLTPVGEPSGIGSATGGLAWNGDTLYALSSGGSTPTLFTLDLATGLATTVAAVTLNGASPGPLTALEFGHDGALYALPSANNPRVNHLLRLDPATGVATDLGAIASGSARVVALANAEPCPGDLNHDRVTDFRDLNEILDDWGCTPP